MNKKFGAAVATVMGLMMAFGFTACGGGGNNSSGGGSSQSESGGGGSGRSGKF